MLAQVREAAARGEAVGLAHARLATSIGYHLDLGGNLVEASSYYLEALAAFRELDCCWDELAMLLNNLAWLYASQGQMILARPLAREALALNEEHRQRYSTGLTLSTLATIENIDGNWREAQRARRRGARDLQRAGGRARSACWRFWPWPRRSASGPSTKSRKGASGKTPGSSWRKRAATWRAPSSLRNGPSCVATSPSCSPSWARCTGSWAASSPNLENPKAGSIFYRKSEETFKRALALEELGTLERAGMLVDYAEMLVRLGQRGRGRGRVEAV